MQGNPRDDREWEHWPGRKPPDEGIQHRLKALFAATDDEAAVDAVISDRGRELEEQTERLRQTIESLERREEQAARLRSAVEEMLRHGSAELDERQAELAALAVELRAREETVRQQERDVSLRKQELGAVELRRAALERREETAAERESALEQVASDLRAREQHLAEREQARPAAAISSTGGPGARGGNASPLRRTRRLALVERDGPVPPVDSSVDVDGEPLVVTRIGRSPLPGDPRACAYLEPARRTRSGPRGATTETAGDASGWAPRQAPRSGGRPDRRGTTQAPRPLS